MEKTTKVELQPKSTVVSDGVTEGENLKDFLKKKLELNEQLIALEKKRKISEGYLSYLNGYVLALKDLIKLLEEEDGN